MEHRSGTSSQSTRGWCWCKILLIPKLLKADISQEIEDRFLTNLSHNFSKFAYNSTLLFLVYSLPVHCTACVVTSFCLFLKFLLNQISVNYVFWQYFQGVLFVHERGSDHHQRPSDDVSCKCYRYGLHSSARRVQILWTHSCISAEWNVDTLEVVTETHHSSETTLKRKAWPSH